MSISLDVEVARLASQQHGVFSRAQAMGLGVTPRVIASRVQRGHWERCQPGVYRATGAPRTWLADLAAAILARPGSRVSHEAAGALLGMRYVPREVVSISAERSATSLPGVVVHRPWRMWPAVVTIRGLPVTTRAATIVDLASVLGRGRFTRVLDDQLASHQVDVHEVVNAFEMQARRGKKGIALLRVLLEERLGGLAAAESELEHLFRELVAPHLLVQPVYQFRPSWRTEGVGRADVGFPGPQLLAELDGRRWHLRDIDNENDHRRDNEALEHGWRTVRYTYRQITQETPWVVRNLNRILVPGAKVHRSGG